MSAEFGYTPLPEANTSRIATSLKLPYRMEDSVGLHTRRTERLMQIGGIKQVTIKNDSNHYVAPVGIGPDGSATGVIAMSAPISSDKSQIEENLLPSACWSTLEVSINEEVAIADMETKRKNTKDPLQWSRIISNAVKDGIISSALKTLVYRHPLYYGVDTCVTLMMIQEIQNKEYLAAGLTFFGAYAMIYGTGVSLYGAERPGRGKRFTLSYLELPEMDRMILLSTSMPFTKITKPV